MAEPPTLKDRSDQPYVSIPIQVPLSEWDKANALVDEVFGWIFANNLIPAGPLFYRYWVLGDMDEDFDIEVGVPVPEAVDGNDRITAGSIPAGPYASIMHHGHPDEMVHSHSALDEWMAEHDLASAQEERDGDRAWNGRFEFFLTNPEDEPDPNKWSMEIAYCSATSSVPGA